MKSKQTRKESKDRINLRLRHIELFSIALGLLSEFEQAALRKWVKTNPHYSEIDWPEWSRIITRMFKEGLIWDGINTWGDGVIFNWLNTP